MNIVKLYAHEIEALLGTVSLSNQQRRLLVYVANNPRSLTLAVNGATAIGNISVVASRLNEKLMRHGYVMACLTPEEPISNRFGESSRMTEWSLFTIAQIAANDPCYDSAKEVTE